MPIEPFKNPSFEWIKNERDLIRWAIAYVQVEPSTDEKSTLKDLLLSSLDVDPRVDPDTSEELNARIDAKRPGMKVLNR